VYPGSFAGSLSVTSTNTKPFSRIIYFQLPLDQYFFFFPVLYHKEFIARVQSHETLLEVHFASAHADNRRCFKLIVRRKRYVDDIVSGLIFDHLTLPEERTTNLLLPNMSHLSHSVPPVNGGLARVPGIDDGSGTFDPASLASSGKYFLSCLDTLYQ
jgi:hypothetical protein